MIGSVIAGPNATESVAVNVPPPAEWEQLCPRQGDLRGAKDTKRVGWYQCSGIGSGWHGPELTDLAPQQWHNTSTMPFGVFERFGPTNQTVVGQLGVFNIGSSLWSEGPCTVKLGRIFFYLSDSWNPKLPEEGTLVAVSNQSGPDPGSRLVFWPGPSEEPKKDDLAITPLIEFWVEKAGETDCAIGNEYYQMTGRKVADFAAVQNTRTE